MRTNRFRKNKQHILSYINKITAPQSTEDIYLGLMANGDKYSISTIYKYVQLLHIQGEIDSDLWQRTRYYYPIPMAHNLPDADIQPHGYICQVETPDLISQDRAVTNK